MRKEYVKPVMESEEFVSNEYVATCYLVTCLGNKENGIPTCGSLKLKEEPNTESYDGYTAYIGTIGGKDGCSTIPGDSVPRAIKLLIFLLSGFQYWPEDEEDVKYHRVTVGDEGWDNHPNASV